MEQLLLVTSFDSPAEIGASFRTHRQCTDGWTDRRDIGNSILDFVNLLQNKIVLWHLYMKILLSLHLR